MWRTVAGSACDHQVAVAVGRFSVQRLAGAVLQDVGASQEVTRRTSGVLKHFHE